MKQKNVQQQNQATEDMIRLSVSYWRLNPLPAALVSCATSRNVDCKNAIILDLGIDEPGSPELVGTLLTSEGRFIQFEIETDRDHVLIHSVLRWRDITGQQNMSTRNPGIGAGYGALALKILHELQPGS